MEKCDHCKDEICTNADSPICADYCPVADVPDVCKWEKRSGNIANLTELIKKYPAHGTDLFLIRGLAEDFAYFLSDNGVIKLPCKAGDYVYRLTLNKGEYGYTKCKFAGNEGIIKWYEKFGKEIFLSEEGVKAKIKELEENE